MKVEIAQRKNTIPVAKANDTGYEGEAFEVPTDEEVKAPPKN